MISKAYASKILNSLIGVKDAANVLEAPVSVYLGLCVSEPASTDGSLANAKEPTVESYARKLVSGSSVTEQCFGISESTGYITNTSEIQMKTARVDYPEKINYWFLSTAADKGTGTAFLWGEIKDVISSKHTISSFTSAGTGLYSATITCDEPLELVADTEYIVSWSDSDGEKEYKEKAVAYTKDNVEYIRLGNALASGGTDDGKPFGILYNETTSDTTTTGTLTIYTDNTNAHNVAIYGLGIVIKKATVPTFYEGELKVSIN